MYVCICIIVIVIICNIIVPADLLLLLPQSCRRASRRVSLYIIGWHYLSKATCLMRPRVVYALVVVNDHHNLLHYLPLWKKWIMNRLIRICCIICVMEGCAERGRRSSLSMYIYIYIYIYTQYYIYIYTCAVGVRLFGFPCVFLFKQTQDSHYVLHECMYVSIYIYIYMYIERERDR